jgi:RND family efflux transporter MFP subunit
MVRREMLSIAQRFSFVVLGLAAVLGCRPVKPAPPPPPPPVVTVSKPGSQEVVDYQQYTGYLDAVETVAIRARVRGFLRKINFQEGSEVKKGDVLYEIDPREFQANVEKAKADLAKAKAELGRVKSEEERSARLRASNAVSEEEYVQKVVATETAKASVDQAQAALQIVNLDLSFTHILAPIDGRIGRTMVTEGNLVGYNEATLLTQIVRMDPIYVYFDVPEQYAIKYDQLARERQRTGSSELKLPIDLAVSLEEGFPHRGYLDFRDNRVDIGTGTIRLRGLLPNADRTLYPGLYARIRVPQNAPVQRLTIPEAALMSDQRGRFVYVVKPDGVVVAKTVTIGSPIGTLASIVDGLQAQDDVVVNGLQRARPGVKVQAQRAPTASATAPDQAGSAKPVPAATAPGTTQTNSSGAATAPKKMTAPAKTMPPAAAPDKSAVPAKNSEPVKTTAPAKATAPAKLPGQK